MVPVWPSQLSDLGTVYHPLAVGFLFPQWDQQPDCGEEKVQLMLVLRTLLSFPVCEIGSRGCLSKLNPTFKSVLTTVSNIIGNDKDHCLSLNLFEFPSC